MFSKPEEGPSNVKFVRKVRPREQEKARCFLYCGHRKGSLIS